MFTFTNENKCIRATRLPSILILYCSIGFVVVVGGVLAFADVYLIFFYSPLKWLFYLTLSVIKLWCHAQKTLNDMRRVREIYWLLKHSLDGNLFRLIECGAVFIDVNCKTNTMTGYLPLATCYIYTNFSFVHLMCISAEVHTFSTPNI